MTTFVLLPTIGDFSEKGKLPVCPHLPLSASSYGIAILKSAHDSGFPSAHHVRSKRDALRLWIPLGLYAASFFLVATQDTGDQNTARGYDCAYIALIPSQAFFVHLLYRPLTLNPPSLWTFSLFMSGWVNPIFLAYVVLSFLKASNRVLLTLKIVLVLMIPFCWIFFHVERLRPREGHFLWILAMLLVLVWHRSGSPSPTPAGNSRA